jgi:hydrogenase maturation protease
VLLRPDLSQTLQRQPGERLLFYGVGNVLRQDDGLGIRFIEELEKVEVPDWVSLDANYQLNAEDALEISEFDVVVFVDALISEETEAGFYLCAVRPAHELTFSTHAMSVGSVLALCQSLSGKQPRTYLLTLPGQVWGLGEGLTPQAEKNLALSLCAVSEYLGHA